VDFWWLARSPTRNPGFYSAIVQHRLLDVLQAAAGLTESSCQ
jgi:hypothetical protein